MLKTVPALFSLLVLVSAAGCQSPVESRDFAALHERREPITRIAVAPFQATGSLARVPAPATAAPSSVATALVARYVTEAIAARGVAVVPADDVALALTGKVSDGQRLVPRAVAQVVATEFGADAVLLGTVHRFDERRGQAAGTLHPASVGFEVTLYTAPGAQRLWKAVFAETQQALSENILSTYRYPGGGMRWLTAEELAKWGAEETVLELPIR
jgi:hypothetical protein